MSSVALVTWRAKRCRRIQRLRDAHTVVGGKGRGRRWLTTELNHSMILRIASEFQGFARVLHNEMTSAIVATLAPEDAGLQNTLRLAYTKARRLDRGNANPSTLANDFGMFGLSLWDEIRRGHPTKKSQWHSDLQLLNEARNALAHDDVQKISELRSQGWPLTLESVKRWHRTVDKLACAMDDVCRDYGESLLGGTPW